MIKNDCIENGGICWLLDEKGLKIEVIHGDYSGIIRGMKQVIIDV